MKCLSEDDKNLLINDVTHILIFLTPSPCHTFFSQKLSLRCDVIYRRPIALTVLRYFFEASHCYKLNFYNSHNLTLLNQSPPAYHKKMLHYPGKAFLSFTAALGSAVSHTTTRPVYFWRPEETEKFRRLKSTKSFSTIVSTSTTVFGKEELPDWSLHGLKKLSNSMAKRLFWAFIQTNLSSTIWQTRYDCLMTLSKLLC